MARQSSQAVAKLVQREVRKQRAHFLVATLTPPERPASATEQDAPAISNHLVDSRLALLGAMRDHHWQWNERRRARFSTMMILAYLGGPPP